ncbi:MAG: sulfocyanin-like copper-binding protein [Polaromonas sp.]|nr:sulfocyanin-like copper-binding protein [Polaromonas sp.]
MKLTRRNCLVVAGGFAAALSVAPVWAGSRVIKVSLWDKGASAMSMPGHDGMMGMGMGHRGGATPMAPVGIRLSSEKVPAGKLTFEVSNTSTQMPHEMVISSIKDSQTPLPYDKDGNKVDEDAAGHLGEVAELEPGKKGSLTLTLKPGRYILYCNIPGHYARGMWTLLTVTP